MLLYVSPPHAHKLYSIAAIIMTFSVEPLDSNLLLMSTNECCRTELKGAAPRLPSEQWEVSTQ